ncbi:MAG: iron-sulfur cluster insertion protein ErpA [Rhodospirillales bacterium]|nr:iron-sulfur cluster insertion protein ErpA [Rhodospirillales bacterium]
MPDSSSPEETQGVAISDSAAKRIGQLVEQEGNDALMLRIIVSGGGCSGFQYGFDLDNTVKDDDLVYEKNGVKVVVDKMSLEFVSGSEIDFKEDLIGSYFTMSNPNATSTCGCGSSFGV